MIKLRCIEEAGIASDLIDWKEGGKFSHVEFILPEGYLGSRFNGGVQIRPFDYCNPVREAIMSVELGVEKESAILTWAKAQIGDSYGWKSVVDVAVNEDLFKPSGLDCSQFVAMSFSKGGFFICRKPFPMITPSDIYNCMGLLLESGK